MTDSKLIEAVATGPMGWHRSPRRFWWYDSNGNWMAWAEESANGDHAWNPLTNDADMDMVLDAVNLPYLQVSVQRSERARTGANFGALASVYVNGCTMLPIKRAILRAALEARAVNVSTSHGGD